MSNAKLRVHIGLHVPQDSSGGRLVSGMRVGTEMRQWEEGRAIVFDDSFEHEVWWRDGGGDDDDGDDGRIFPEHPSPILHAPRDIISRKGKSLTPIYIRRPLGHEPCRVMKRFPQTPLWEGFPLLKTLPWAPQTPTRGSVEYQYAPIDPVQKKHIQKNTGHLNKGWQGDSK